MEEKKQAGRTILDCFENTAITNGKRIAVKDPEHRMTYGELFETAQRMAAEVAKETMTQTQEAPETNPEEVVTGYPVAIFAEKSCSTLAAMLSVIYAGGFYVCINPEQTASRIGNILQVLQPRLVIVEDAYRERLQASGYEGPTLSLDHLLITLEKESSSEANMALLRRIRKRIRKEDPLYGIFTSGSTGTPKCVLVEQQAVMNFIGHFVSIFGFSREDVIGNQAPFDFDVSVKDIYSAWFTGARLVLIPREYFSTPPRLLDYICDNQVTNLTWAVSALCLISGLKGFGYRVPKDVKRVLFSGEVMPIRQLTIWQENLPEAEFVNLYGPSEITCNCTYYRVQRRFGKEEKLPLGQPFPGRQVLLLDEEDRPIQEPDIPGEICVLGESLAGEYYHNREQTEAHFVLYSGNGGEAQRMYRTGDLGVLDRQGQMFFAGRKDFQIKHMGHRIELEEIELALNALDGVERSCCSYDEKRSRITAYYTGNVDGEGVHRRIKQKLPAYMVPWKFVHVKAFELNKNGKIDRKILDTLEVIE